MLRSAIQWAAGAVAAGALLAILGPFGSYLNDGPVRRAAYWIGAMLLGLVLYGASYRAVAARVPPGSPNAWLALIAATLLASIPEALATRAAAGRLWPDLAGLHLSPSVWFAQTFTIGLVCMAGMAVLGRGQTEASGPFLQKGAKKLLGVEVRALPEPRQHHPALLGGDVLALQMEDHYVRVHRSGGSELVLMPLSRAIERAGADGLQTHRSWWVANHAIASVEGNARSMRLRLSNGLVAPVARSAVTHLRAAGWIET